MNAVSVFAISLTLLLAGCWSAERADGLVPDGYLCVVRNSSDYDVTIFRNGKKVSISVDGVGERTVLQPLEGGQIVWTNYPQTRLGVVLEAIAKDENGSRVGSCMWTAHIGPHGTVLPWLITNTAFSDPPPEPPAMVPQ
jgi:hypothetical protein